MAPALLSWLDARITTVRRRVKDTLYGWRARRPAFDHLARAWGRYQDQRGDQLAGGITYFVFLSFFPLVALGFAAVGYLVTVSPTVRDWLEQALRDVLPGLADRLRISEIARARTSAGLIGLAVLLYSGLGWVGVLRAALRSMWMQPVGIGNPIVKKLWDVAILGALAAGLIISVAVTSLATSASRLTLGWLGLEDVAGSWLWIRALAVAVAIGFDVFGFALLFSRLSGTAIPPRELLRGALFGAVGLEALKLVATALLAHTLRNPVYTSFAVAIGLLVWINFVARFTLFTAAWTATSYHGAVPEPAPFPGTDPTGETPADLLPGPPPPAEPDQDRGEAGGSPGPGGSAGEGTARAGG